MSKRKSLMNYDVEKNVDPHQLIESLGIRYVDIVLDQIFGVFPYPGNLPLENLAERCELSLEVFTSQLIEVRTLQKRLELKSEDIKKKQNSLFLDTRARWEWEKNGLSNSEWLWDYSLAELKELDNIVLISNTGRRAFAAAAGLSEAGVVCHYLCNS